MKKIRNLIVYLGLGIVIIFVYPMPHKIFSGQDLNKISTPDFRQAEWGMNKEQVKKLEKSELIGEL